MCAALYIKQRLIVHFISHYSTTIRMKIFSPVVILSFLCVIHYATSVGINYERWGRTTCRNGATLLYDGYAAGGYYSHSSGGAEYICLVKNPVYSYSEQVSFRSAIYSTEYENVDGLNSNLHNYDAPCAVCYVETATTKLMIPGQLSCHSSWTLEYSGFLMSNRDTHANSKNYVCVDGNAEYIQGSNENRNGALMYHVTADCGYGFLPCNPYQHMVPITCVVCTK